MTTIIERAARAVAEKLNADAMAMPGKRATDADVVRAVLQAIRDQLELKQEGEDWMAEYGESEGAAIAASKTSDFIAMIDAALEEG